MSNAQLTRVTKGDDKSNVIRQVRILKSRPNETVFMRMEYEVLKLDRVIYNGTPLVIKNHEIYHGVIAAGYFNAKARTLQLYPSLLPDIVEDTFVLSVDYYTYENAKEEKNIKESLKTLGIDFDSESYSNIAPLDPDQIYVMTVGPEMSRSAVEDAVRKMSPYFKHAKGEMIVLHGGIQVRDISLGDAIVIRDTLTKLIDVMEDKTVGSKDRYQMIRE